MPVEYHFVVVWVPKWGFGVVATNHTTHLAVLSSKACLGNRHRPHLYLFMNKGSREAVLKKNKSEDRWIITAFWGHRPLCHTTKIYFRQFYKRPLKLELKTVVIFLWTQNSRLNISVQTHLMKIWCRNQPLIRHEGSLDKSSLVLLGLPLHCVSSVDV